MELTFMFLYRSVKKQLHICVHAKQTLVLSSSLIMYYSIN